MQLPTGTVIRARRGSDGCVEGVAEGVEGADGVCVAVAVDEAVDDWDAPGENDGEPVDESVAEGGDDGDNGVITTLMVWMVPDVSVDEKSVALLLLSASSVAPVMRLCSPSMRLKMTMDVTLYAAPRSTSHHASPYVLDCSECVMSPVLDVSITMLPSTAAAVVYGDVSQQH